MGNRLGGLFDRWFGGSGHSEPHKPALESRCGTVGGVAEIREAGVGRRSVERNATSRPETLRWLNAAGYDEFAAVEVDDNSDFGMRVQAPAELAVGETVWLTYNGDIEKCIVRYCNPLSGGYSLGLYRIRDERRREDRDVVEGKADLFWGGAGSEICHIEVNVRDVSTAGMQVLASRPIPPQTAVRVSGQDYACLGVTCYCRPEAELYSVGIQFTHDPYYKEGAEYND